MEIYWAAEMNVSIHVPARGTTVMGANYAVDGDVSIHVPARGTTLSDAKAIDHAAAEFQSTFPRGERPYSNHLLFSSACFTPRSREGNDENSVAGWKGVLKFQSTFPRGERHISG